MQSVLSVQAARADKAIEKREMEGKTVCKAGQSKCNMVLGVVGANPHPGSAPGWQRGWEKKTLPSLAPISPCLTAVTVKLKQGLSPCVLARAPKVPRQLLLTYLRLS